MRFFAGLRPFTRAKAFHNVFAGATLASMNIPQVLGYTRIAGTAPITGLYTVLLPLLGFAAFGASPHLVVAADSATAAIFSSSLSRMATPGSEHYMALTSMVALITSGFLLVARVFKLGFLADFMSRTVLVGFLAGVGVQVSIAMLGDTLNLTTTSQNSLVQAWQLAHTILHSSLPAASISLLVIIATLSGKRYAPRVPIPLLSVVSAIAASPAFHFQAHGIATIGKIPAGLPSFDFPAVTWSQTLAIVPISASCFVMIIAQSAATVRAFAARHDETIDADADIIGLAVANAAAALSGAFVVNGSPTQTAMADQSGATSQFAQVIFAGIVLLILLFFTRPLQYLPRCVLGAIVITIAIGMIDIGALRDIRRESPGEFILALVTAATVVVIGVEQAIFVAMTLSLFRHVRHSYRPHTAVLIPGNAGNWLPWPVTSGVQTEPGLALYRFGSDLFYANYKRFVDDILTLTRNAQPPVRWIIVEASAIINIDFTAAHAIIDLVRNLTAEGKTIVFGRVSPSLRADMDRHGITVEVGTTHIFTTLHEALETARAAHPI